MSTPTQLGQIGMVVDDSGTVTSLSLVVGTTIAPDPTGAVVFFIVSSPGASFPGPGVGMGSAMVDNQPDPGGTGQPGNLYAVGNLNGGSGQFSYAMGHPRPTITPALGLFCGTDGATDVIAVSCIPYWGLTAGTVITITISPTCKYAAAVGYGYSSAGPSLVAEFNSGTIDPANTETGDSSFLALSSALWGQYVAGNLEQWQLVGIVISDSANGDISDLSGDWTPADTDTSASEAITWQTFLADGSVVVLTSDPICDFTTSIGGTAIIDKHVGFLSMSLPFTGPAPPAAGIPVLTNHLRLSE